MVTLMSGICPRQISITLNYADVSTTLKSQLPSSQSKILVACVASAAFSGASHTNKSMASVISAHYSISSATFSAVSRTTKFMAPIMVTYCSSRFVYGANHLPLDLPLQLTHVFYAFIFPYAESRNVKLTDEWTDVQLPIGKSKDVITALMELKALRPTLKVIVVIGGWGQNAAFQAVIGDILKRNNFVNSAIDVVKHYGFDRIEID